MPATASHSTIGKPFTELMAVDSSNNYAMARIQNGAAAHGEAWFAHYQTKGKGRMGKEWQAEAGANIMLSVALETSSLLISEQFYLSAAMAVSAFNFFSSYAKDETKIKWPNDIFWRDRKAAGILIESVIRGNKWQWTVVGIGININQTKFPTSLGNPVSLKQITGKTYDAVSLAKELCEHLDAGWNELLNNKEKIIAEYNSTLYKRGEQVKLKKGGSVFECVIDYVDSKGQMHVQNAAQETFSFGEVEWVIK